MGDAFGEDGVFGTWDDGLCLGTGSGCIDRGDADAAPKTDVIGRRRFDHKYASNNPSIADMGAYEGPYYVKVVAMCWIDETRNDEQGDWAGYHDNAAPYDARYDEFAADLAEYRDVVNSVAVVKSGCLAPLKAVDSLDVLFPRCYAYEADDPPAGITTQQFPRRINEEDSVTLPNFTTHFDRIREGLDPDYVVLSVDWSGWMTTWEIQKGYSEQAGDNFVAWLGANYPEAILKRRDEEQFKDEAWIKEISTAINTEIIDKLQ